MRVVFLGMGGHAKNLLDICTLHGYEIDGYIDDAVDTCPPYLKINSICNGSFCVLGFVGLSCEALERRYNVMQSSHSCHFPNIIHPSAVISPWAQIDRKPSVLLDSIPGTGIQVMANAVIHSNAFLGDACIINTGAIVEHDAQIGVGCHIAPGAVVLGGAKVGDFSFVGANATVVQGASVPARSFIKAGTVWKQQ